MSTITPGLSRRRNIAIAGSAVFCAAISLIHVVQPDWLAPVILVPPWCWLPLGIVLAWLGCHRNNKRWSVVVLALWAAFTAIFVEEVRSLVRIRSWPTDEWTEPGERGRGIRVVSLNCASESNSAEEIAVWKPDIVLLQESPNRQRVELLSRELHGAEGAFLHGGDTSIVARGWILPKTSDQGSHFVHAEVESPAGLRMEVISVRLAPPVFRLDFWTPGFWTDHRERRMEHREQIRDIVRHLQGTPTVSHLIVGGDFNSPPYDYALSALQPRLCDSFRKAGRGWGATGTNDYPLFRVDQIWVSQGFRASSVTAQKTLHSDHRMVVCDLILHEDSNEFQEDVVEINPFTGETVRRSDSAPMEPDRFWEIIEQSRTGSGGDVDIQCAALADELRRLIPREIESFAIRFSYYKAMAYDNDLWGVIYIAHGGCGDDSFIDFRYWLISRGRSCYESAIDDSDGLVDQPGLKDGFAENFWLHRRKSV